jgi:Ca-activated chloride channel homolog
MKKLSIISLAVLLVLSVIFSAGCSAARTTTSAYSSQSPVPSQSTAAATTRPAITTSAAASTRPATTNYPQTTRPATTQAPQSTLTVTGTTTVHLPPISVPMATTVAPSSTSAGIDGGGGGTGGSIPSKPTQNSGNIGLSTGGAKDISNFRENIRNNYLPLPTDVTYEGLFYDYYFDTGATAPANKLFSPSYCEAVTRDPFSQQTEYYLSVGLNSGLKESDFKRKDLNLVIVLDNSGSMNEQYNQYYYDGSGNSVDAYADEGLIRRTKMDSANQSVVNILKQLTDDDWLSIVTFNSQANLVKPMGPLSQTSLDRLQDQVLDILPGGSTNLDSGLDLAAQQFKRLKNLDSYQYENRIIVLSDAQPNTGDISSNDFLKTLENLAGQRIYTTFIGVGVDFNSSLIEQISGIKGCNYYSVHSPRQFEKRVEEEFEYMVTPLIFDVELKFESRGWKIEKVFGSPQADQSSGRLLRIDTLFASKSDDSGQVKGGLVLLKLQKTSSGNQSIYLRTTYEDRNGHPDGDVQTINLETVNPEYFDNTGIRKGVLLTRYAALLKNWMSEERQYANTNGTWRPTVDEDHGIVLPSDYVGQWERQSVNLTVSPGYHNLFQKFAAYFATEMKAIGDQDLGQELDILNRLDRY